MPVLNQALTLDDLPPAPTDKNGWPWTEQSQPLPEKMPDSTEWSCISVVTPSYNQGNFIEETIRSVLLQGYPNLEYIIIDGGSTDETIEIIKKYERFLSYWTSEADRGQSDAINKGFQKCNGEIVAFLNSDDLYLDNTLSYVAQLFRRNISCDFICGQTEFVDENSEKIVGFEELFEVEINDVTMTETCHIAQPSTFFRKKVFDEIGYFSETLFYCFDYEFWLRAYLSGLAFSRLDKPISYFRIHNQSKTKTAYESGEFDKEFIKIYEHFLHKGEFENVQKRGLRRGLAIASALLFVHLELSNSSAEARRALFKVVCETPEVLLSCLIWPTLLVSLCPSSIRRTWRRVKKALPDRG